MSQQWCNLALVRDEKVFVQRSEALSNLETTCLTGRVYILEVFLSIYRLSF